MTIAEPPDAKELAEMQMLCDEVNLIAEVENSPWEPRCIAVAFAPSARTFVLTMQSWIALDAIQSPVLLGSAPETQGELVLAMGAFGLEATEPLTPEEAAVLAADMCEAVALGFSTVMPMRPDEGSSSTPHDGFGRWLPIFACLVVQCGLSIAEANALPVAQAHALLAAMRRNQGWREIGTPYNLRDMEGAEPAGTKDEAPSPASAEEDSTHG